MREGGGCPLGGATFRGSALFCALSVPIDTNRIVPNGRFVRLVRRYCLVPEHPFSTHRNVPNAV